MIILDSLKELTNICVTKRWLRLRLPQSLPGMGFDSDMFDDFSISPEDMDIEVVELDNHTWDTCINMISSHSNMVSIPGKALKLPSKKRLQISF
jgi:hypothetical protein